MTNDKINFRREDKPYGQRFAEDWLFEMPVRRGQGNDSYEALIIALEANKSVGFPIEVVDRKKNQFMMRISDHDMFVWQELDNTPEIIIELEKHQSGYAVVDVGKRLGSAADAADFYSDLSRKFKRMIFSGDSISDRGANIWKKLIGLGHSINVYDTKTVTSKPITSPDEIDNPDYNNSHTRFVLSENKLESMTVWNKFHTLKTQAFCFGVTPLALVENWHDTVPRRGHDYDEFKP
jgi:hypothetical protein